MDMNKRQIEFFRKFMDLLIQYNVALEVQGVSDEDGVSIDFDFMTGLGESNLAVEDTVEMGGTLDSIDLQTKLNELKTDSSCQSIDISIIDLQTKLNEFKTEKGS